MLHRTREQLCREAGETGFDVAVVGGGINGASLYHELCARGYRVLLVDKGDFACGTSQSSAMMVWGGLLYLRNLDFKAVIEFSLSRDRMIQSLNGRIRPQLFRYIPAANGGRNRRLVQSALYLYWALSFLRRRRPSLEAVFPEADLIKPDCRTAGSILFEEGMLNESDCRFVLDWITGHAAPGQVALNHSALEGGGYSSGDRQWRLELRDLLTNEATEARARCVVNCAGVWADRVNGQFGIESPYRHRLSKGVFIGLRREAQHESPVVFDLGEHDDTLLYLPWGPVSMVGPTETPCDTPEDGFRIDAEDVDYLLGHANRRLHRQAARPDIAMLRCGVRPLAVRNDYDANDYPLDLTRRFRVVRDKARPWFSTYGGKITGCNQLAKAVADAAAGVVGQARPTANQPNGEPPAIEWDDFPGMPGPVPSIGWCARHESCCTLDDYLRRRTNIAQWIPREGLGEQNENLPALQRLAKRLHDGQAAKAEEAVRQHVRRVEGHFDRLTGRKVQHNGNGSE
ncbi:MAG: FAD-dependent oxidoreductase [Verrucomicrobia bacterium]|nr:FAD-dependent oxidoreductase [Verrucomicrobiota bacterium]